MCLTCGCLDAHKQMGHANIRYEDVKRAADENGTSVAATLLTMNKTLDIDRPKHPAEYVPSKASTNP